MKLASVPASNRPVTTLRASEALRQLADRPSGSQHLVVATGLDPLDRTLLGGLHDRDLVLLGGLPGSGKTIAALQIARNAALAGTHVTYVCYEHDPDDLLARLLLLELGEQQALAADMTSLELLRDHVAVTLTRGGTLAELAAVDEQDRGPLGHAVERLEGYADRLRFVAASGRTTTLGHLDELASADDGAGRLLVVDYLQKVAVHPEPIDEAAKVTQVTEGLKDLALSRRVPVLAVVAADRDALDSRRLRLHHLRGSSALAYEADAIVLLNDKAQCVSKVHLSYDPVRARSFRDWVVCSLEKNRRGPADVQLEFRKDFTFYRLDPSGRHVNEQLVDERLSVT